MKGRTLLHWACAVGTVEHVTFLLKNNYLKVDADQPDSGRVTPLMLAATCLSDDVDSSIEKCKLILQRVGILSRIKILVLFHEGLASNVGCQTPYAYELSC